jgi:hypothetical protein
MTTKNAPFRMTAKNTRDDDQEQRTAKSPYDEFLNRFSEVACNIGGEKGPEGRGSMSLFGVLRLRLSQETAPNSAQDDEFNDENNF